VIHVYGVLMVALEGVAVAFVTFALFAALFLVLLGAVFVGTGWGIHRELIVSRRFGNMRRPIFRWTSRIYAMTMVFAGVFAVILAAAMRFLAVSHVVVPSVLASCAAAWVLRPRGARVIDVPSDDSVESSFIRHVTGLLCF